MYRKVACFPQRLIRSKILFDVLSRGISQCRSLLRHVWVELTWIFRYQMTRFYLPVKYETAIQTRYILSNDPNSPLKIPGCCC